MPSDVWNSDDVRKVLINPMYCLSTPRTVQLNGDEWPMLILSLHGKCTRNAKKNHPIKLLLWARFIHACANADVVNIDHRVSPDRGTVVYQPSSCWRAIWRYETFSYETDSLTA